MAQVGSANTLGDGKVERDQVGHYSGIGWGRWLAVLVLGFVLTACGTSQDEDSARKSGATAAKPACATAR